MKSISPVFLILCTLLGCGKKEEVEHHANANTSPASSENESLPKIKTSEGEQKIKFTNRLPESGAWALYDGKLFLSLPSPEKEKVDNGKEEKPPFRCTLKISSLGTQINKGKKCQVVEVEVSLLNLKDIMAGLGLGVSDELPDNMGLVLNLKFDSDSLEIHEDPLRSLVALEGGVLTDGQFEKIDDFSSELLRVINSGLIKPQTNDSAKKIEKKIIETKIGKLECTGDSRNILVADDRMNIDFEVRRNDSVPFKMVSTSMTIRDKTGKIVGSASLDIQATGKDAVSKMNNSSLNKSPNPKNSLKE